MLHNVIRGCENFAKFNFYQTFNSIMGKFSISRCYGSVMLFQSKCFSILSVIAARNPTKKVVKLLDYVIICTLLKIFSCNNSNSLQTTNLFLASVKCLTLSLCRERFFSRLTKSSGLLKYLYNFLL